MTYAEYNKKLSELEKETKIALDAYRRKLNIENALKLVPFQEARIRELNVNNISIGDVISDTDGKLLLVKKVLYCHAYEEKDCYLEFKGILLTKAFKPKKNQEGGFVQQRYGFVPSIIIKTENKR